MVSSLYCEAVVAVVRLRVLCASPLPPEIADDLAHCATFSDPWYSGASRPAALDTVSPADYLRGRSPARRFAWLMERRRCARDDTLLLWAARFFGPQRVFAHPLSNRNSREHLADWCRAAELLQHYAAALVVASGPPSLREGKPPPGVVDFPWVSYFLKLLGLRRAPSDLNAASQFWSSAKTVLLSGSMDDFRLSPERASALREYDGRFDAKDAMLHAAVLAVRDVWDLDNLVVDPQNRGWSEPAYYVTKRWVLAAIAAAPELLA